MLHIDGHIEGSANPKGVSYDLDGKYDKYNIKSALRAKHSTIAPRDYDVEFEVSQLTVSL